MKVLAYVVLGIALVALFYGMYKLGMAIVGYEGKGRSKYTKSKSRHHVTAKRAKKKNKPSRWWN